MALKRILALVFSALAIVGAVLVRDAIDNGGSIGLGGSDAPIVCDSAIAEACRAAFGDRELTIEDPGDTFDRLVGERTPAATVWIVGDPWPEMLAIERDRTSLPALETTEPAVVATTRLGLLGRIADCEPLSWACLASSGRSTDIGLDSLDQTAGLLAYSQVVAAFLGRQDFASNDFADQGFRAWRTELGSHVDFVSGPQSALDLFLTRPGTYDAVAALEADAVDLGRGDSLMVPDTGPSIDLVGIGIAGAEVPRLDDLIGELTDRSWQPGSATTSDGPSPGVLTALRAGS